MAIVKSCIGGSGECLRWAAAAGVSEWLRSMYVMVTDGRGSIRRVDAIDCPGYPLFPRRMIGLAGNGTSVAPAAPGPRCSCLAAASCQVPRYLPRSRTTSVEPGGGSEVSSYRPRASSNLLKPRDVILNRTWRGARGPGNSTCWRALHLHLPLVRPSRRQSSRGLAPNTAAMSLHLPIRRVAQTGMYMQLPFPNAQSGPDPSMAFESSPSYAPRSTARWSS